MGRLLRFGKDSRSVPWRESHGPMARSRHFLSRPVLYSLLAAAGVTTLLSLLVVLANSCVILRCDIDDLQREQDYLEAKVAQLTVKWNRASAPDVVISRAEKELGLITPDRPGIVIVMLDEAKERQVPAWRRFLGTVGGGGEGVPAVSAQSR